MTKMHKRDSVQFGTDKAIDTAINDMSMKVATASSTADQVKTACRVLSGEIEALKALVEGVELVQKKRKIRK